MQLTDTHTHLYYERNAATQDQMMQRCFKNQINRLFLPNVDVNSITMIDELVNRYPTNCFAMAGLHPCSVKDDYQQQLETIEKSIPNRKIIAIGEIGIDLYWDKSTLPIQQKAFEEQIKWAKNLNLPVVIHCREAFDEVFEILEANKDERLRGIFHCFTGNGSQAQRAINLHFYLGIGGVVTYPKAGLDSVLQQVMLKHLVLETDAPYLAPVPHRGKPNESSYLLHIAQKVSDIYQIDIEEVATITTANSKLIFGV